MTLLDVNEFHGVIAVSAAYVVMYYVYMCAGPASHEVGASEAQQRWGRRIFGNLHEQSPAFLLAMWSFAAFVSPQGAADLGKAYLVLRAMYPLIWLARGDFDPTIFSCTIPQYGIIIYMMASVFALSHFGLDLRGIFLGYHTLGAATFAAVFLGGFFGMCALTTAVKSAGFFPAPVADKKKA